MAKGKEIKIIGENINWIELKKKFQNECMYVNPYRGTSTKSSLEIAVDLDELFIWLKKNIYTRKQKK